MFDPKTYQDRRARLSSDVGSGLIVLLGNEESSMNYKANVYPFRQDSTFLYFFGLDAPNLAAVIDADEKRCVIFGDDPTVEDIVWMGPQVPLAERAESVAVKETLPSTDLAPVVAEAKAKGRDIHFLPPYRGENSLRIEALTGIPAAETGARASVPLIQAVVAQRSIKSDEELSEIEKSIAVSYDMHTEVMRKAQPGLIERDLFGISEGIAIAGGGRPSFPIILTVHGETLHNPFHENRLEPGQLLLHDSGSETEMRYCSDITRTFPVSGRFTPEQREVYEIVLRAQEDAIGAIKPGVPFRDVHLLSSKILAEGMKSLGVMKGDMDDAVREGAHAIIFQCGLGHMMGLDVHDMENLGEQYVGYDETMTRSTQFGLDHLRLARPLQEGFVVTVEPGVYFIPELMDQWRASGKHTDFIDYDALEKWRAFGGIRIEDDVVVTADGYRVLGKAIPKTVDEVEALAGENL